MDHHNDISCFEKAIRATNRLITRNNRPLMAKQTLVCNLQEAMKFALFHRGTDFYKIFQKRSFMEFRLSDDGYINYVKFFPKDERDSTFNSCTLLNAIFNRLQYEHLAATNLDSIENFNIFSFTKEKLKAKKLTTQISVDFNNLTQLTF